MWKDKPNQIGKRDLKGFEDDKMVLNYWLITSDLVKSLYLSLLTQFSMKNGPKL